ncbi:SDR family oxidoreductase [Streptosporangium sp. OZ121]|uniref:SDR family oxidoreductase n=1 Tax=Streptosporangium sp. OZ121 TaxID=3444183 RepID=UPI003F7AC43E
MTKTALITGANKGIGFETARLLAERGITAIIGSRDEERGRAAAESLGQPYVQLDVTDAAGIQAAADRLEKEYGTLDILVNNAGILSPDKGLPSAMPMEVVRRVFETNVFGVIAVTNAMLPMLRRSSAGRIVNVSSELASMTNAMIRESHVWQLNDMPYNSSKAALNMVTVSYAKELWDTGIKVNAGDPGWCATDIHNGVGPRTAEQGAAIAVYLATLDADGPSGTYIQDAGVIPW